MALKSFMQQPTIQWNPKGGGFQQCPYCKSRMNERTEGRKTIRTCTKDKTHVVTTLMQ